MLKRDYIKTKNIEKGSPIPVVITAYKDKTFKFITKLPPLHKIRIPMSAKI